MTRDDAVQEIRSKWRYFFPPDKSGKGIVCPICDNGSGSDGDGIRSNPKSKKPGGLICFKCGFKGDILDLLQQTTGGDYNTVLRMAADQLNITIDPYRPTAADDFRKAPQKAATPAGDSLTAATDKTPQRAAQDATEHEPLADYMEYYGECMERLMDPVAVSYLQARGISLETAAARVIGYDPAWISPAAIKNQRTKGSDWTPPGSARIIIPVTRNHYIARAVYDDKVEKKYRKQNETGGGDAGIFGWRELQKNHDIVFVTEGAFDALSIMEAGRHSIALNSAGNAEKLIRMLQEQPPKETTFILCLDEDEAGQKASETLKEGMEKLNIRHITADICNGYKDPNEALVADRAAFIVSIQQAEKQLKDDSGTDREPMGQPIEWGGPVSEDGDRAADPDQEPAAAQGDALPGLLTYTDAVNVFETADNECIELKSFPEFSKTAKVKRHDSIVIAADTGGGKSSLAINFLNDLNEKYPCIYINLEMDTIEILRRLVAIQSGIELDRIGGYQNDERTAGAVNAALKIITDRQPLQIVQDVYRLEEIKTLIKNSTKDREKPTIVIVDHTLLVKVFGNTSRYERFTTISEELRQMSLKYNIILFVLLQQNREGKKNEEERPQNSSLKESGSWENDATHICFLWYDPADRQKKILMTKNRHGAIGDFPVNYYPTTQTYIEKQGIQQPVAKAAPAKAKQSKREKQKQKLIDAYERAYLETFGHPTIRAMAEAADVTTATIKSWIKEHGGCTVQQDPAGIDAEVEYNGFIKLTPGDEAARVTLDEIGGEVEAKKGQGMLIL